MKRWLYIMLLLFASQMSWANGDSLSVAERNAQQGFNDTIDRMADDFVRVGLIVAEPGEILYSSFGHAMLHLQCETFDLDYIFSYESEPIQDNWGRFLRGDLKLGMYAIPTDSMLYPYKIDGRGVLEYPLNLSPSQEQKLWQIMDELVAKGADQPYDYYNRGCAVSVVHVVKEAIGKTPIHYGPWPDKFDGTLRELGYECVTSSANLWNRFALMTLAGSDIDNPHIAKEKKLIVPADLANIWQHATLNNQPLLREPQVLVASTISKRKPLFTPLMASILLLVIGLFSIATIWISPQGWRMAGVATDYTVLIVCTLVGVIISYVVFISTLPCTDWNWLIVVFNPLPAIFWHWRKYWALPYAGIIVAWCIAMLCVPHRLVETAHILLALSFAVILLKQSPIFIHSIHKQK